MTGQNFINISIDVEDWPKTLSHRPHLAIITQLVAGTGAVLLRSASIGHSEATLETIDHFLAVTEVISLRPSRES